MTAYADFLVAKATVAQLDGHEVDLDDIHWMLKPHQRLIVQWAVRGGRRAIFAAFGTGKTIIQIETLRLTIAAADGRALIVCPLGVQQEFAHDADMLDLELHRIRTTAEALALPAGAIAITNYEPVRDGKLDPNVFAAVSLDEAAILRSFGSKTYQTFLTLFDDVPARFVATATPSPNRYKELIHYAGFLGIMETGQALTRFFKRDSTQANNLTLLESQERNFWLWLASWSAWVQSPADLCGCACHTAAAVNGPGSCAACACAEYMLPELAVVEHEIAIDHRERTNIERNTGQAYLLADSAVSLPAAAAEKRATIPQRLERLVEIIHEYQRQERAGVDGGRSLGAPAGAEPRALPAQPRGVQGEGSSLARTESGARSRTAGGAKGEGPGEVQGDLARLVRGEQAARGGDDAAEPAQEVRPDAGAVRRDADRADRAVPDLRGADETAGGRSRPRHRGGAGPAVSAVQCGAGNLPGRPEAADASDLVSDQIIIWVDLNAEQRAVEQKLDELGLSYSSIYGTLSVEEAEARLAEWRAGRTYALIGKPVMLGVGLNLQRCNKAVFFGITYKFHQTIQAVHRIQRFGQSRPCEVHLIYAESEREILRVLLEKWRQHEELTATMSSLIQEHGLSRASVEQALTRSLGVDRVEVAGDGWRLVNNDCVPEVASMPDASVGLVVTSIPFSNHYEYTPAYEDLGFTESNAHFWQQMDYLTPQLLRVLAPGRIYACHVKDRILFGNVTGAGIPTSSPFHAEAIMHGRAHGFDYLGMVTVVTDVVRENNQTYRLGWSEQCKDATKMGVGSPEYILLFHKPQTDRGRGYADEPVTKSKTDYSRARWQTDAHAFWRSSGDRHLTPDELAAMGPEKLAKAFTEHTMGGVYDYESHVRIGEALDGRGRLPSTFMALAPGSHDPMVWHDVNRMRTLNGEQAARGLAQHICPLQLDIVDRLIVRYSNEGDVVFDPFSGLGTVPLRALALGRQGLGVELNGGYFLDAVKYLEAEQRKQVMPTLFSALEAA